MNESDLLSLNLIKINYSTSERKITRLQMEIGILFYHLRSVFFFSIFVGDNVILYPIDSSREISV